MTILAGFSSVAVALSSACSQPEAIQAKLDRIRWANPNIFSARSVSKEAFVSPGFYYGDYHGRKSEIKEFTLGASFTERLTAWYSHQDILLKGRASTSRYRNEAEIFGVRWLIQEAGVKPYGLAVELETVRPSTATVRTSDSMAKYPAPDVNRLKIIASDRKGVDGQVALTRIEGVNSEEANLFDFGVGKDLVVSERWTLRLQGHLIGQNLRNTLEEKRLEIKPVAYAALAYKLGSNAHLETDLTWMPSGTPLAFGRLTGLTAFQIYQPGGVAAGLRRNAFGVGAIRLLWRTKL